LTSKAYCYEVLSFSSTVHAKTIKPDKYKSLTRNTGSVKGEKSIDVTSTDISASTNVRYKTPL